MESEIISDRQYSSQALRLAQRMFGFVLPSFLIEKRSNKFYMVK